MRRLPSLFLLAIAVVAALAPHSARAQVPPTAWPYSGAGSVYGAPGNYGMSYGVASYGVPRTYSEFNSPYGLGYSYGYAPVGFVPGRYGMGLWRPGFVAPSYSGSATSYRTFPARTWPVPSGYGPAVGAYAPGFGPTPLQLR